MGGWTAAAVVVSAAVTYYTSEQQRKATEEQTRAASRAADLQREGMDEATATQMAMFEETQAERAPWRERLEEMIEEGPGEFEESPGYKFVREEGLKAIERGVPRGGARFKAGARYATGLASTEYDNFLERYYDKMAPIQSLAGVETTARERQQLGVNLGNLYAGKAEVGAQGALAAGAARASGYAGQANIWGGFGQQTAGLMALYGEQGGGGKKDVQTTWV